MEYYTILLYESKHASSSRVLHPTQVWLNSLPMQLGRRLMNIEAIFRRPRGEQTDRERRGGEVDMDRSCHIPIQFLRERGTAKKNQRHLTTTEETWNGFVLRVESCNRSAVYLPAAVLGCYLQIRRTMRGRGGWKAVRQSDESPGGRSTRVTWKPPKFCKKRKLPATQK